MFAIIASLSNSSRAGNYIHFKHRCACQTGSMHMSAIGKGRAGTFYILFFSVFLLVSCCLQKKLIGASYGKLVV